MPVNSTHPKYDFQVSDWIDARVTLKGERAVRADITRYLPVPPGMGVPIYTHGYQNHHNHFQPQDRYGWYSSFAEFPEIVAPTVEAFQGLIHMKPAEVTLPSELGYLVDSATVNGAPLQKLWETVTRELIAAGRVALVGEVLEGEDVAVSCPYKAETLINWDVGTEREGAEVRMSVFQESIYVPSDDDDFKKDLVTRWREMRLLPDGTYGVRLWVHKTATNTNLHSHPHQSHSHTHAHTTHTTNDPQMVEQPGADINGFVRPMLMGQAFNFVPLSVGNANGVGFDYGHIPALPLSKRALSIFRRSADYNRALYNKGDPQAYIAADIDDEDKPTTIGGSELWILPQGGKADYLDIDGQGIPLMREAINDDFHRFVQEAGRFLESNDRVNPNESGRAVEKRLNAQRVTLRSLVIEAARLMRNHLIVLGKMMGLDEEQLRESIVFKPNMDFTEVRLSGQELVQYVNAKNMGAPWSFESMHQIMKAGGLTDLTFEDEVKRIVEEAALIMPAMNEDDIEEPGADDNPPPEDTPDE